MNKSIVDVGHPYRDAYESIYTALEQLETRQWGNIYDGKSFPSQAGGVYSSVDPATELPLVEIPDADESDVDAAIDSGLKGFEKWRKVSARERGKALRSFADLIRSNSEELALIDSLDSGSPLGSMRGDIAWASEFLDTFADWALMMRGETIPSSPSGLHYTQLEPYGVVGRIIPFNHPALFAASKVAAPLLAGNSVVLKASEQCPLSAIRIGELAAEVFPPGVFNVVTGSGPLSGQAIVRSPKVARIAFIGSETTGREIQRSAAESAVKNVTLELGGKNAMVVLADADPLAAAEGAVKGMNFTATQGESCGSNSRLLVHRSIIDEVVNGVVDLVEKIRLGVPIKEDTQMGALVSAAHLDRVSGYVETGVGGGAELVTGGARPDHLPVGYFLQPTVFTGVTSEMRIAQEEIFGPVLSVMEFESDAEALRLANDVRYGLTASVWTNQLMKAKEFIDGFAAGYVWVNDSSNHFAGMPFGGVGASGVGREESLDEVLSFCQVKSVNVKFGGHLG